MMFVERTSNICSSCVDFYSDSLKKETAKTEDKLKVRRLNSVFEVLPPSVIKNQLDKHVIGQEKAKKNVSVSIYNHCKKILNQLPVKVQKSNVLMIGPTGVGKTLIAETLADILGVPFVITDATTITESGYAGDDASVLIQKLFQASNYDITRTEVGIVYIDEIDKKSKRNDMMSLSRDVSGEGVQQSLLKLMEGTTITVDNKPGNNPERVEINTKNILFMVGGAFVGLDNMVKQRLGKKRIGFNQTNEQQDFDWETHLETGDLVKFGLIPEFCGRLPSVCVLHQLDRDHLVKILTDPEHNIIRQLSALFKVEGVNLEFTSSAIKEIADIAIEQNLGARGLRKILDEKLLDINYELPELAKKGITGITINERFIRGQSGPMFIKGKSN